MSADISGSSAHHTDPADLLNAYLDDELDDTERSIVDQALADSPALRRELDELRATQALLRALPLVEPLDTPFRTTAAEAGAAPSTDLPSAATGRSADAPVVAIDRHRRRKAVGMALGAIAAGLLVVLGVGASLDPMPVAPPVDELASAHLGSADAMGFDDMDAEAMDDPAVLAGLGDGMDRMGVYARNDLVRTVYSDGSHDVSVFHRPGIVDWAALPADGEMSDDGPTKTWTGVRDETVVTVAERGDLVVVVVADADMGGDEARDTAMEAVEMVPPVSVERGLWDRVRDAPANLVDRI